MILRIDHVVFGVRTTWRWRRRGSARRSVSRPSPGGTHPTVGYGEPDRVARRRAVRRADRARRPARRGARGARPGGRRPVADGDRWFALCLADDDLDATAARLGLAVEPGGRSARRRRRRLAQRGDRRSERRTPDLPVLHRRGTCRPASSGRGAAAASVGADGYRVGRDRRRPRACSRRGRTALASGPVRRQAIAASSCRWPRTARRRPRARVSRRPGARSAIRSSGCSIPTESRTRSAGTSSGEPATLAWVIGPGHLDQRLHAAERLGQEEQPGPPRDPGRAPRRSRP